MPTECPALNRLIDFLKIPSVSTDPAHKQDVADCADWVVHHLKASGFANAQAIPTSVHPVVHAATTDDMVTDPTAPRILFYGHYDVQPPDPLELWTSPPFEPVIQDNKIFARGACDDKGQVASFLEALRRYADRGEKLPCHVTVLIEGEEEAGSIGLMPFLDEQKGLLAADVVVVSDTSMWTRSDGTHQPAITYAMRGLVYFDVKLHGPARDLHSGAFGNVVANPATELIKAMGKLKDADNRVTIPGFYDDVADLPEDARAEWDGLDFDEKGFFEGVGGSPCGEAGYSTLERLWSRPSCDFNGLYGGYMKEGAKTVIPAFAGIKVSFRLPANMNPHTVCEQFTQWCESQDTGGCRWEFTNYGAAWPVLVDRDNPFMQAASEGIKQATGMDTALIREGASIPIIAEFKTKLGLDSLLIGFGLNDDAVHSPNENFGIDRFNMGIDVHEELLKHFGKVGKA